jgi:hypothetical protein
MLGDVGVEIVPRSLGNVGMGTMSARPTAIREAEPRR